MRPNFNKLDNGEIVPIGYQWVNFHMIFDVKIEDLWRKARLVAGGHVTEPPSTITYEIILSMDIVRIDLTLSALNYLPVKVADIHNSYIPSPVTENIWKVLGQEFGEDDGRKSIVVCALNCLKSAGADFRNHLAECMHHLGFLLFPAELYLWMNPMMRPEYGFNYYTYVLIYMDDVMVIHNGADIGLQQIDNYFKLNPISIVGPESYWELS